MADKTSAHIFGRVFTHLALEPDERNKQLAWWLWEQAGDYDFTPSQMQVDEALRTLGLMTVDKVYTEYYTYAGTPNGPINPFKTEAS